MSAFHRAAPGRRGRARAPARHRIGGFSMIEVLIALVILAVGLLGLALLQTMNLRYTKSAELRTQAVNLAGELLDTMRSNRSQIAAYTMQESDFGAVAVGDGGCGGLAVAPLTAAGNVARWQCEVVERLGAEAYAEVAIDANDGVIVSVVWDESLLPTLNNGGRVRVETTL